MGNLPAGWRLARVDELGTAERGRSRHRPRNDPKLYGGPYPFVQTGDIKAAGLHLYQYTQTYSEAGLAQSRLWPVGTLCITIAANICDTSILGIPACFPDSIVGFTPHEGKSDVVFVRYALEYAKQRFTNISRGATQDNLSLEKLLSQQLPIPPFEQQRRIASILGVYDDLIEVNQRRIALLEEMARRLFEEWFVRFRFPGHEGHKMVKTPGGRQLSAWAGSPLSSHVSASYGYTATANEQAVGPKFLRVMDINKSPWIDWDAVPYCVVDSDQKKRFELEPDDLVVARMADTGKIGFVERRVDAIAASYLVRLRPIRTKDAQFLFYLLTHRDYQNYVAGASTGATRKSAGIPVLTSFHFLCPPQELREKFSETVSPMRALGTKLVQANSCLAKSRDLLLPRLVSGDLSIADAERELEAVA